MEPRPDGLPTLGMAMIARNEAPNIERCFASFWDHVDQVVLVDTGSTDGTIGVAKKFASARGDRDKLTIREFEWCDDFAAARTASWDLLETDFGLWCDLDDLIAGAERLRALAAAMPPEVAGYIFRYNYAQDPHGNCVCELWRERLVRRGIGERWDLPVHEVMIVPGPLIHSDVVEWVHHHPVERVRDPERNYKILRKRADEAELADELPDPRTLAYLGTEALVLGRPDEAVACFRRYLDHPEALFDEERCQVCHKLSIALRMDPDPDLKGAEEAGLWAIRERPDWPDGYIDLAEIALRREKPQQALHFCDQAAAREKPRTLLITNPLEYDYQPALMRSVALAKLGDIDGAWEATQKALAATPDREDLHAQAASIAQQAKTRDAVRHLLSLRELLVRHDENDKARRLMECAPYFTWSLPEVVAARHDQREMTLHAHDPEVYSSYYRENPNEAPFELQQIPIPEAHQRFHRVDFLRRGLVEQAKVAA